MQQKIYNFLKLAILLLFCVNNVIAESGNKPNVEKVKQISPEEKVEKLKANISVISAKAKPSLSGSNNSAAYVSLHNANEEDIVILRAIGTTKPKPNASSIANRVEMHIIATDDRGVSKMVPVDRLVIPAGSDLVMKPGGIHIMLLDLKRSLNYGDKFYINFIIQDVGTYQVEVEVGKV